MSEGQGELELNPVENQQLCRIGKSHGNVFDNIRVQTTEEAGRDTGLAPERHHSTQPAECRLLLLCD